MIRCVVLSLLLGTLAACVGSRPASWPHGETVLFRPIEVEGTPAAAAEPWARRAGAVGLNPRVFGAAPPAPGDTLELDVFGEARLAAQVAAADSVRDLRTLRAHLLPPHAGDLVLTTGSERAVGTLLWTNAGRAFRLLYDQRLRTHVLVEVDPAREDVLPGAPPLEPLPSSPPRIEP